MTLPVLKMTGRLTDSAIPYIQRMLNDDEKFKEIRSRKRKLEYEEGRKRENLDEELFKCFHLTFFLSLCTSELLFQLSNIKVPLIQACCGILHLQRSNFLG
jgi:hypothetical protein